MTGNRWWILLAFCSAGLLGQAWAQANSSGKWVAEISGPGPLSLLMIPATSESRDLRYQEEIESAPIKQP